MPMSSSAYSYVVYVCGPRRVGSRIAGLASCTWDSLPTEGDWSAQRFAPVLPKPPPVRAIRKRLINPTHLYIVLCT
jgi:hypothetical protein